jgi:hypothetical protein
MLINFLKIENPVVIQSVEIKGTIFPYALGHLSFNSKCQRLSDVNIFLVCELRQVSVFNEIYPYKTCYYRA